MPLRQEEVLGLDLVVGVMFKQRAMQVIGSALNLYIDGGAPAKPCSASKLFVTTFTSSMASIVGTNAVACGSQGAIELAPSMRVLLIE